MSLRTITSYHVALGKPVLTDLGPFPLLKRIFRASFSLTTYKAFLWEMENSVSPYAEGRLDPTPVVLPTPQSKSSLVPSISELGRLRQKSPVSPANGRQKGDLPLEQQDSHKPDRWGWEWTSWAQEWTHPDTQNHPSWPPAPFSH